MERNDSLGELIGLVKINTTVAPFLGNSNSLNIVGNGGLILPKGNISQRPTDTEGMIRYNTETSTLEINDGTNWYDIITNSGLSGNVNVALETGTSFPITPTPNQLFYATSPITVDLVTYPLGLYYYDDPNTSWNSVDPAYVNWSVVDNTPTTLAGYGITNGAVDTSVVHLAGTETITGFKTFSTAPLISAADTSIRAIIQNTSSTAGRWPGLTLTNFTGGFGGYPVVEFQTARGSFAAAAAVQSGDVLGSMAGWGWDGTTMNDAASIHFVAGSNFNGTTNDGAIEFYTQSGTTIAKRMTILANGTIDLFPGSVSGGNFYLGAIVANPLVNFDANDYISYDRTGNAFNFVIGGTNELSLSSTTATFGGNVSIADNNNLYIGTGNDLYAVHNGTDSHITNQTGHLYITNIAAGGALVLRSENASGSNIELLLAGAYIDAGTTYIRSQDGTTEYARFASNATEIKNGIFQLSTSVLASNQIMRFYNSGMPLDQKMVEMVNYGTNGNFEMRVTNDAYTQAAAFLSVTRGSGYTISDVTIGGTNVWTSGNLIVGGNLTINGTTTTINTTTLTVDDKNIELGSVASPTNVTADGGGITLKGLTDKTIIWDNANANWTSSEGWNLAVGKSFKVNNVDVLNATTLGSSVVNSSLTSVGTLSSLAVIGALTGTSFNSITGLSSTSPAMDGTATVGTGTTVARADHVHPSDTSKLSLTGGTVTGAITLSSVAPSIYFYESDAAVDAKHWLLVADGATFQLQTRTDANGYVASPFQITRAGNVTGASFNSITGLSSTSPVMDGTATVGTGTTVARADHVHPTDTTRAADNAVVHLAGTETITGAKTFSTSVTISGAAQGLRLDGTSNSWIEMGRTDGTASTPFMDFHSGATAVDFDARIIASGGTGVEGNGTLLVYAGTLSVNCPVTSTGVVSGTAHDTAHGRTTSGGLVTGAATTQVEVPLSLAAATYRTVEYTIQATVGATYHTSKIHAIHDGTDTWVDEYAIMWTSASLYTATVDVSGGNIRLLVTPTTAVATTFKVLANAIEV